MATCNVKLDLNEINDKVIEYYKELMDASTAQDSIYLKAKETLTAILDEAGLDNREKSSILSQTIASMVSGLSSQAMQGAIDLAKDDRDAEYVLAKLCADTELSQAQKDKLIADTANVVADTNNRIAQGWLAQAQLFRDYGVIPDNLTYTHEELDSIDYDVDYGTKHESIRLAQGNVYNTYANAYRQNGLVTLAYNADGSLAGTTSADTEGLTYWQTRVAERNESAFDDNMRQHVANSSATLMSMLLSTDASGIDYSPYLNRWTESIEYLNTTLDATAGTITNITIPTISLTTGGTIEGETTNINAGTAVSVEISIVDGGTTYRSTTIVGIVQLDGTWSAIFDGSAVDDLIAGTGTVTSSVLDATGRLRYDTDAVTIS